MRIINIIYLICVLHITTSQAYTQTVSTYAGTGVSEDNDGKASVVSFNDPLHIAINSSNEIFITDKNNHKISKITCVNAQPPPITTSTGSEDYCPSENTVLTIKVNTTESNLEDNKNWVWHKETCDGPILYIGNQYEINPKELVVISVRGEDGCFQHGECQTITINVVDCKEESVTELKVFNTFSPNNDGVNDVFEIDNLPNNSIIYIYNKWGDLISENTDYNDNENVWDGKNNFGKKLIPGSYYYTIEKNNNNIASGWVQLIR